MKAGDKWVDSGLIFTTHKGTSLNPNNVWRALSQLLTTHNKHAADDAKIHQTYRKFCSSSKRPSNKNSTAWSLAE